MYKSQRVDIESKKSGDFRTLLAARKTMDDRIASVKPNGRDSSQPIFNEATEFYIRLTLKNGASHWCVAMFGSNHKDDEWFSCIASHPGNGVQYKLIVHYSEIASFEEFPPEAIEVLPTKQQPFGFASHPSAK